MEREYQDFYDSVFRFGQIPRMLRMNKNAKKIWIACHDSNTGEILEGKLLKAETETWLKMMSQLARITLIIHVCRLASGETESGEIDEISIMKAWTLVDYFKANIRKVYSEARTIRKDNKLQIVIRILKDANNNTATAREIQRATKKAGQCQGGSKNP